MLQYVLAIAIVAVGFAANKVEACDVAAGLGCGVAAAPAQVLSQPQVQAQAQVSYFQQQAVAVPVYVPQQQVVVRQQQLIPSYAPVVAAPVVKAPLLNLRMRPSARLGGRLFGGGRSVARSRSVVRGAAVGGVGAQAQAGLAY